MFAPSKARPAGPVPSRNDPTTFPSLGRNSSATLFAVTQMFTPLKARAYGEPLTAKVPRVVPSLARSLVTVPLLTLPTQILAPSNARLLGCAPTVKVPALVPSRLYLVTVSLKFVTHI